MTVLSLPNNFFCFALGIVTSAFLLIPLKAFFPTVLRTFDLTVMVLSFLQPLNASLPIVVMFLPIVICLSFLLFLKALSAIFVTLYLTFLTLTVAGTETFAFAFL